jgi:ribonuclease BN (tRNA processing enzyme)
LHRAAAFDVPWADVTHLAITHFHVDHWGELAHFLFALRWGIEPPRRAPLTLIGPSGFEARLVMLSGAMGDWVLHPEYPLEVVELSPGEARQLAGGIVLEACATPHTPESLAYGVRHRESRMVYTGDTGPSDELAAWATGADLLLAECSLPEHRALDVHLTPRQAGRLARVAEAGRLVLTHLYPVFDGIDPAAEARAEYDGEIVVARDGDRFTIGAT